MKICICVGVLVSAIVLLESVTAIPWLTPDIPPPAEIHDVQTDTRPTQKPSTCSCDENVAENVKPTIVIFLSSTRPNRMSTRMGKLVLHSVEEAGMRGIILDPAEIPFEMLKTAIHFFKSPEEPPIWMKEVNSTIANANGYIAVSAEYNGEIPPAMTNMLDHFPYRSFAYKPAGIVTYSTGAMGGIRVGSVLRTFLSNLGMLTLPTHVAVGSVAKNIDEEGFPVNGNDTIVTNLSKLVNEVKWFATAIELYEKNGKTIDKKPLYY